jgi:hypothetical protein
MARLATTTVETDQGTLSLALDIKTDGSTLVIDWTVSPPNAGTLSGNVTADLSNPAINQFSIHIPTGVTGLALCLAGCVAKSVIGPLIECLSASRDPQKVLDCLKSKGISIGSSAIACALGCLATYTP